MGKDHLEEKQPVDEDKAVGSQTTVKAEINTEIEIIVLTDDEERDTKTQPKAASQEPQQKVSEESQQSLDESQQKATEEPQQKPKDPTEIQAVAIGEKFPHLKMKRDPKLSKLRGGTSYSRLFKCASMFLTPPEKKKKKVQKDDPNDVVVIAEVEAGNNPGTISSTKSSDENTSKSEEKDSEEYTPVDYNVPDQTKGGYYCNLCNSHMYTVPVWLSHIEGKKHLKKMAMCASDPTFVPKYGTSNEEAKLTFELKYIKSPIVGLDFLTETQRRSGKINYACHVCQGFFSENDIVSHLLSSRHQTNYIQKVDPDGMKVIHDMRMTGAALLSLISERAFFLETKNGRGKINVMVEHKVVTGVMTRKLDKIRKKNMELRNAEEDYCEEAAVTPKARPGFSEEYLQEVLRNNPASGGGKSSAKRFRTRKNNKFNKFSKFKKGKKSRSRANENMLAPEYINQPYKGNGDDDFSVDSDSGEKTPPEEDDELSDQSYDDGMDYDDGTEYGDGMELSSSPLTSQMPYCPSGPPPYGPFGPRGPPFYGPRGPPFYGPRGPPFYDPRGHPFYGPRGHPFYGPRGPPFYGPSGPPFYGPNGPPSYGPPAPPQLPFGPPGPQQIPFSPSGPPLPYNVSVPPPLPVCPPVPQVPPPALPSSTVVAPQQESCVPPIPEKSTDVPPLPSEFENNSVSSSQPPYANPVGIPVQALPNQSGHCEITNFSKSNTLVQQIFLESAVKQRDAFSHSNSPSHNGQKSRVTEEIALGVVKWLKSRDKLLVVKEIAKNDATIDEDEKQKIRMSLCNRLLEHKIQLFPNDLQQKLVEKLRMVNTKASFSNEIKMTLAKLTTLFRKQRELSQAQENRFKKLSSKEPQSEESKFDKLLFQEYRLRQSRLQKLSSKEHEPLDDLQKLPLQDNAFQEDIFRSLPSQDRQQSQDNRFKKLLSKEPQSEESKFDKLLFQEYRLRQNRLQTLSPKEHEPREDQLQKLPFQDRAFQGDIFQSLSFQDHQQSQDNRFQKLSSQEHQSREEQVQKLPVQEQFQENQFKKQSSQDHQDNRFQTLPLQKHRSEENQSRKVPFLKEPQYQQQDSLDEQRQSSSSRSNSRHRINEMLKRLNSTTCTNDEDYRIRRPFRPRMDTSDQTPVPKLSTPTSNTRFGISDELNMSKWVKGSLWAQENSSTTSASMADNQDASSYNWLNESNSSSQSMDDTGQNNDYIEQQSSESRSRYDLNHYGFQNCESQEQFNDHYQFNRHLPIEDERVTRSSNSIPFL